MKKSKHSFLYRNGLIIAFLILTVLSLTGQFYNGLEEYNTTLAEHGQPPINYRSYFTTGHFIEATFENWESEFLQMLLFVIFTIFLRQQGSSESKSCDEPTFKKSELKALRHSPWPLKKGGLWLELYKYSLSISLLLLFIFSFLLHLYGSFKSFNEEQLLEGRPVTDICSYAVSSKFWFESFQNWQSEFLSIFAIIFLSIYLRQMGSSQSKAVNAANYETGAD
jgi:hypothetical protein